MIKKIETNLYGLIAGDTESRNVIPKIFLTKGLNVNTETFVDDNILYNRLITASENNQYLDFLITHSSFAITTNILKKIRNMSDDILYHNGLRLKHIPILVLCSSLNTIEDHERASNNIIFTEFPYNQNNFCNAVAKLIAAYRKSIIEEFTNEGFGVQFLNGKYVVTKIYEIPPHVETKYFKGISTEASKAITRKIVVQNTSTFSKASIRLFEELLNLPQTSEKDLQDFFRNFPEFILDSKYDILFSENPFKNEEESYRSDILAQPRGLEKYSDQWVLIELKKHSEKILTDKKYHADFTKAVYNAITQLKNYQEYFDNPINKNEIETKYHGIVPNPKLTLIIGRTPNGKMSLLNKMRGRFPEITITTYDELLDFRKIQVSNFENFGI